MNFDFARQINQDLEKFNFKAALKTAESALVQLPETSFHEVLGKPLTSQAEELADWIEDFYQKVSEDIAVEALYFEMNEFDINTDYWYIDGFAYTEDGGLNGDNMDWLSDWDADTNTITGGIFAIEGYEKLQNAFETIEPDTDELQNARDWSEQIIIARFMELMRAAHLLAGERELGWAAVPVYFTEHSYDFIVRSEATAEF